MSHPSVPCFRLLSLIALISLRPLTAADYAETMKDLNPLAYWRFNETVESPPLNTVSDSTSGPIRQMGYAYSGAKVGEEGIIGRAVRFSNPENLAGYCQSKVDVPLKALSDLQPPFTIEFWAKTASLGSDTTGFCPLSSITPYFFPTNRSGWIFYVANDGRWQFRAGGEEGYVGIVSAASSFASPGQWQHIAGIFDGTLLTLYINGVQVGSQNAQPGFKPNRWAPLRIGGTPFTGTLGFMPSGNRGFDGWVDEVAIFGAALSAETLMAHFVAATTNAPGYAEQILRDSPVGYWRLDESSWTSPDESSLRVSENSGSVGPSANSTNRSGTLTSQEGVPYAGLGSLNEAVFYNGADGVSVPGMTDALRIDGNPITLMAWIKPMSKAPWGSVLSRGFSGNLAATFLRIGDPVDWNSQETPNNSYFEVGATDGSSGKAARSRVMDDDIGRWTFLAGTWDRTNWNLFKNGALVAQSQDSRGPIDVPNGWAIGGRDRPELNPPDGSEAEFRMGFFGLIDEPAIFNRALSGSEILGLYRSAGAPPFFETVWDGGGDRSSWNDGLNWSNDSVPSNTDDVLVDDPGQIIVRLTSDITVRSLTSKESIWVDRSLTLSSGISQIDGNLEMAPGATLNATAAALNVVGGARIDGGRIHATGVGSQISIPQFLSYQDSSGCCGAVWEANGDGSKLDFPAVTNLFGNPIWSMQIRAVAGGQISIGTNLHMSGLIQVTADGTNSLVDLRNAEVASGVGFFAEKGGSLRLDRLQSFEDTSGCCGAVWEAKGESSKIEAPTLSSLIGNPTWAMQIRALEGGRISLGTNLHMSRLIQVTADGANSLVDLRNAETASGVALYAENGGSLRLDRLQSFEDTSGCCGAVWEAKGEGSHLEMPALSQLVGNPTWPMQIQALEGGQLTIGTNLQISARVYVTANGLHSKVDLSKAQQADGVSLYAEAGGQVDLGQLQTFTDTSGCCGSVWEANGIVSRVVLPSLLEITGNPNWPSTIQALNGGTVAATNLSKMLAGRISFISDGPGSLLDLPRLSDIGGVARFEYRNHGLFSFPATGLRLNGASFSSLSGSIAEVPLSGSYVDTSGCCGAVWEASGSGSQLILSGVTNFSGNPNWSTTIQATTGGAVTVTNLLSFDGGNIYVLADGTNSVIDLSGCITNQSNLTLEARNGGRIIARDVREGRSISLVEKNGGVVEAGGLGRLRTITLETGTLTLPGVTNIDGLSIYLSGGSRLSLPNVRNFTRGCDEVRWQANGPGTILDLPGLTNISAVWCNWHYIEALNGGLVNLRGITTIGDGPLSITATGTNSLVDLSSWTNHVASEGHYMLIEAAAGGEIRTPQLTDASRVAITLRAGGKLNLDQVARIDGGTLYVFDGEHLSLPSVGNYTRSCDDTHWQANGTGSVLDLPGLTNIAAVWCNWQYIETLNGGVVKLSGLKTIGDGPISIQATGTNSLVDLSSWTNHVADEQHYMTMEAAAGGEILTPQLVDASRIRITLRGGGKLNLERVSRFDGGAVYVFDGEHLSLPSVGNYTRSCDDTHWQANGAGSVLGLPGLTNIAAVWCNWQYIEALNGGIVNLSGLKTIGDGPLSIQATGTNSLVDLSSWTNHVADEQHYMTMEAAAGGEISTPQLIDASRVRVTLRAGGKLNFERVSRFDGGTLYVFDGEHLSLSNLTNYAWGCDDIHWQANGAGSVLDLPGLTNISAVWCTWQYIEALNGGVINLSGLKTIGDGPLSVTADGLGSVVRLDFLAKLDTAAGHYTMMEARNGGEIVMPSLLDGSRTYLTLQSGGRANTRQFSDLLSLSLVDSVTDLGGLHHLVPTGNLSISGNGVVSLPGITNIDGASLYVENGAQVELPSVHDVSRPCSDVYWRASGVGSRINLSGVTNVSPLWCGWHYIQAVEGGVISLEALSTIADGAVAISADGTNSFINLPNLTSYRGSGDHYLSMDVRTGGEIFITNLTSAPRVWVSVHPTGRIETKQFTDLLAISADGVSVELPGLHQFSGPGSGITLANGGAVSIQNVSQIRDGAAVSVGAGINLTLAVTNVDGASLYATGGGTIVVPGIKAVGRDCLNANWWSTGAGSVIDLPNLAQLNPVWCNWNDIRARDGGRVQLASLQTIGDGAAYFLADGGSSVVDLSSLNSYEGTRDHYAEFDARNSGRILMPEFQQGNRLRIDLQSGGGISLSQFKSLVSSSISLDGTSISFPVLKDITDSHFSFQNGGQVNPPPPHSFPLVLNGQFVGRLPIAFAEDIWTFSAVAGQQVQLNFINASTPGVAFDLTGPGGWVGFSDIKTNSDPVTFPVSGKFEVHVHGIGGQFEKDYAFKLVETIQTDLLPDSVHAGQFVASGQAQIYRVSLTNSRPMRITLNNSGAGNVNEVYVRLGSPPTRGDYDFRATGDPGSNRDVIVPTAASGSWYILVYGGTIVTPGEFSIKASTSDVFLTDVFPHRYAFEAPMTLNLTGAGFDNGTRAELVSSTGAVYPATSVGWDSFTQLSASFAANAAPAGVYSVRIKSSGDETATLSDTLTLVSGPEAKLDTKMILPSSLGYHAVATIYVECANQGTVAMPAPLLIVRATQNDREGAWLTTKKTTLSSGFWTSSQPEQFGHSVQILASGRTAGLIQPGESISIPIYYAGWQQPWDFKYSPIQFSVIPFTADNTTPMNWDLLKDSMKPASMTAAAWDALWPEFAANFGSTWGNFIQRLSDDAGALTRLGESVTDVSDLLGFEMIQANGLSPVSVIASSVDASIQAPGLPIVFRRSFGSAITSRQRIGPLGRGWTHNWDYHLETGSDGLVTLVGPGEGRRAFQPDSRRAGAYFSQPGDHGVLTNVSGNLTLKEPSGLSRVFLANGNLDHLEDLNGNRISAQYDGARLTNLVHSSGQSISIAYAGDRIRSVSDYLGRETRLAFDATGEHLEGAVYFDGRTASYTYGTGSANHAIAASFAACCNARYFDYDAYGRLTAIYRDGGAEKITLNYLGGGKVTATDALGGVSAFYYDHRGLLARSEDPLGRRIQREFDENFNLIASIDPVGHAARYNYDLRGNVVRSVDALGNPTLMGYHPSLDHLTSLTDANKNPTLYDYAANGNLASITYADNSIERWDHDVAGNPTVWTNRRGHPIRYAYNATGQITSKDFVDGSGARYEYDHRGNLTNAVTIDPTGAVLEVNTMAYDSADRLALMMYTGGQWLRFTYDSAGRRTSSLDQLGHRLGYTYDFAGRLYKMTNELGELVVQYGYDRTGRLATKNAGNVLHTSYTYDAAGQLLSLTNALATGNPISWFNYTYDERGRRISMDAPEGTWSYSYDDIGQLTHAVFASRTNTIPDQDLIYVYDALGNRIRTIKNGTSIPYIVNQLNQYVKVGEAQFVFDADGNLSDEITPFGIRKFIFDDSNRLIEIETESKSWRYGYDAIGDRSVSAENSTIIRSIIDPLRLGNLVGTYLVTGEQTEAFEHGLAVLSHTRKGESKGFYSFDGTGTVTKSVSTNEGIQDEPLLGPFAELLSVGTTLNSSFLFQGASGVINDSSGLKYMRARYFSPELGRFLAPDPSGLSGGFNRYAFAWNNPISFLDPTGLFGEAIEPHEFLEELLKDLANFPDFDPDGPKPPKKHDGPEYRLPEDPGLDHPSGSPTVNGFPEPAIPPPRPFTKKESWRYALDPLVFPQEGNPYGIPLKPSFPLVCDISGNACSNFCSLYPSLCKPVPAVPPSDPNSIAGPAGSGNPRFIAADSVMPYRIDFENEVRALAPAQQVVVTEALSPSFDLKSFQWTEIGFGDRVITVPPNLQHFETTQEATYRGTNFTVTIELDLDATSRRLRAIFRSINPETSLPPPVEIGFLPPEDGTGRGQGHVNYKVKLAPNLLTGLQVRNVAYISFDNLPEIGTNQLDPHDPSLGTDPEKEAYNTIDADPPTSAVESLPAQVSNASLAVSWVGSDTFPLSLPGSGVAGYDVYVSTNGSPWMLWLANTPETTAIYRALENQTCSFYVLARDYTGQQQVVAVNTNTTTTPLRSPPFIEPLPDKPVIVGSQMIASVVASSFHPPLTFALDASAPPGARILTNGVVRWSPPCPFGSSVTPIKVWAIDSGTPQTSNSMTFSVLVSECIEPSVGSLVLQTGQTGRLPLRLTSTSGLTNLTMTLRGTAGKLNNASLEITATDLICTSSIAPTGGDFLIRLGSCQDRLIQTPPEGAQVGWIYLTANTNQSTGISPLSMTEIVGSKPDGTLVKNDSAQIGRTIIVADHPLLEAVRTDATTITVTLFGTAGLHYIIESIADLEPSGTWKTEWIGDLSGSTTSVLLNLNLQSKVFIRCRQ